MTHSLGHSVALLGGRFPVDHATTVLRSVRANEFGSSIGDVLSERLKELFREEKEEKDKKLERKKVSQAEKRSTMDVSKEAKRLFKGAVEMAGETGPFGSQPAPPVAGQQQQQQQQQVDPAKQQLLTDIQAVQGIVQNRMNAAAIIQEGIAQVQGEELAKYLQEKFAVPVETKEELSSLSTLEGAMAWAQNKIYEFGGTTPMGGNMMYIAQALNLSSSPHEITIGLGGISGIEMAGTPPEQDAKQASYTLTPPEQAVRTKRILATKVASLFKGGGTLPPGGVYNSIGEVARQQNIAKLGPAGAQMTLNDLTKKKNKAVHQLAAGPPPMPTAVPFKVAGLYKGASSDSDKITRSELLALASAARRENGGVANFGKIKTVEDKQKNLEKAYGALGESILSGKDPATIVQNLSRATGDRQ